MKSGNEEPLILYFVQLNFPRGHSSSSSPFSEDYSSLKHSLVLEDYIWTQYCLFFKDSKICFSKIYVFSFFHQRFLKTKRVDLYDETSILINFFRSRTELIDLSEWKWFAKLFRKISVYLHHMLGTKVVNSKWMTF